MMDLDAKTAEGMPGAAARPAALRQRVLLITGMSGAGKTSALKAMEDLGYEAVDHVPISLLMRLVLPEDASMAEGPRGPIAVGIDIRTRDFEVERCMEVLDRLAADSRTEVSMLFLDCDDDELRRRYTATRHRHPLALDRPVTDGISLERETISALRDRSDLVIDTTGLPLGAFKGLLRGHFAVRAEAGLTVVVVSFSFRLGLPREADLVFDVRFLANPFYDLELRPLTGRDPAVAAHIERDDGLKPFLVALDRLLTPLLPRYAAEGKSYLTIGIGCTGGRHRSVYIAECLAKRLGAGGQRVHLHHRDLERYAG